MLGRCLRGTECKDQSRGLRSGEMRKEGEIKTGSGGNLGTGNGRAALCQGLWHPGVCSVLGHNSRITPRASCWSFPSGLVLLLGVHSTKQKLVKNVGKCSGFVNFGFFFYFKNFLLMY